MPLFLRRLLTATLSIVSLWFVWVCYEMFPETIVEPLERVVEEKEVIEKEKKLSPWEKDFIKYKFPDIVDIQVFCVAKSIFHEARGENYRGKVLVAQVIINRTSHRWFPNTPCEVVYQPSNNPDRPKACAFSFTCDTIKGKLEDEPEAWDKSYKIALDVLYGLEQSKWTKADHYFRCGLNPSWSKSMEFLGRVGKHCYYKSRG